MPWICASCTTEHESNDPPCRKCGHEQFAELDETTSTPRVETATHVEWECPDCGTAHSRNNPPCDSCGSMQLAKADGGTTASAHQQPAESGSDDSTRQTMFYVGAVLAVAGVILFPFVFFLVAMPESIYRMRGSTMQKYFPKDARDNPAVSGTMLIFGWFGHFLWLSVAVGFVLGLLLF